MTIEVRLLGPFEAISNGDVIPLGQPKKQALLALLALHHTSRVAVTDIIDALWDETAPARVRNQIQVYIAGLRRTLAAAGAPGGGIETISGGYRLHRAIRVDLANFDLLLRSARERMGAGDFAAADRRLEQALDLWRGPALAGIPGNAFQLAAYRLNERRADSVERRLRVRLSLGYFSEIIGDLRTSVANYPLREGLRYGLMVALYRCGRSAEALAAYHEGRRFTVTQLGVEPGPELQALHLSILRGDEVPAGAHPPAGTAGSGSVG